jgi:hypothetical protein
MRDVFKFIFYIVECMAAVCSALAAMRGQIEWSIYFVVAAIYFKLLGDSE